MSDALTEYRTRGWTVFDHDPDIESWARAVEPVAMKLADDPVFAEWMRCDGTWFVGVNALPNGPDGSLAEVAPPLAGAPVQFVREALGYGAFEWDAAQVSIIWPGYPRKGDEDTEASWRYRVKRCAAHVDGLERSAERKRNLSETHGFLLGIPLRNASEEEGAFVIWEGSHEIMREAFARAFGDIPPDQWREADITESYVAARQHCFGTCEMIEIAPGLGSAYVMHPLALHGVAPWRAGDAPPRAIAYFRPDTFGGDAGKWLRA